MLELATAFEIFIVIAAPIALARALLRRYPVKWATVYAGAGAFIASQVVHLPVNARLMPLLHGSGPWHVPIVAVVLGLSAGVHEEVARYVVMRWARPNDRSGPHALAFGIGHGGVESILIGLLCVLTFVNMMVIDRVGLTNLGLDDAQIAQARASLAQAEQLGAMGPMLGAFERLCTIPFHVAASTLVMRAVVRRRPVFVALAILLHAVLDGGCVVLAASTSPAVAEVWVAALVPVWLVIIIVSVRSLPRHERRPTEKRPHASGAPIELVRAEKHYGDVRALDGVSFTLREGERACLLGPNGAGKTTSIRLVTGALAPSSGFVFVFGQTGTDEGFLAQKRRLGIVPQQPGMYEEMTVRRYLAFVRELYAPANPDDDVAERLGLHDVLDRPTSALSGGMQRRLVLAAALLPRPDLLVLDEPSAGLDPVASRQMIACVKEASAGRTTLLCTHNLAEAEDLCDSVVILRAGKVVVHASIEELRSKVAARIALRAHGGADALAEVLRKRGHTPQIEEGEVFVSMEGADRAAPGLLRELLADGVDVYECRIVRASLEDLFFRVVESSPSLPPAAASATAGGDT